MFNYKLFKLRKYFKSFSGRNNSGKITIRHRSRGIKKLSFIKINDFIWSIPGIIMSFDFDFKSRSWLGLISMHNGIVFYSILSKFLGIGSIIQNGFFAKYLYGNSFFLKDFICNSFFFNLKLNNSFYIKSSGCYGIILNFSFLKCLVKLPSNKQILVSTLSVATLGIVLDSLYILKSYKKAGSSRSLGRRPSVRGVAMNPVDHPHGGGEGKSKSGRPSVSIWGWLTK